SLTGATDGVTWRTSVDGVAPLGSIDMRANAHNAAGTSNYTFYCDRSDNDTDIKPGFAAKVDGSANTEQIVRHVCGAVYNEPGTYHAKVIIENGARAAQAHLTVTVAACSGPECGGTLSCQFSANPSIISPPRTTTLGWTCNEPTMCTVRVLDTPRAGTAV